MSDLHTHLTYVDAMKLDLPEINQEGVVVTKFEVSEEDAKWSRIRALSDGRGRISAGTYTKLGIDGALWMSDTPDEMRDHSMPFYQAQRRGGRVLINGLGAGMVLGAMLKLNDVEHIDVVETDERIVRLLGREYADPRVTIHYDDAFEIQWPVGTHWDVVWHDIWLDLTEDNLPEMHRLHRKYGRRAEWQGSWGREFLEYQKSRYRGFGGF